MSNTIYSQIISKLQRGELSSTQETELSAIRQIGDIDLNDQFWIHFLPVYFLLARRDDEKINMAAVLDGVESSSKGKAINQKALVEAVAARLEGMLEDISPNTDPVVLARAVAKAATPAIQLAVEDATANCIQQPKVDLMPLQAIIKESLQQAQEKMVEAGRDAIFNRHIAIMVAAGILLGIAGVWWGGYTSELQYQAEIRQAQNDIKDLKVELKASLDRSARRSAHQ